MLLRSSWGVRGFFFVIALSFTVVWGGSALAYDQYSQNGGDNTNCGQCHGDFRANDYVSATDSTEWGNLHNIHRFDMLDGDCDTCHSGSASERFPVILNSSNGGDGLAAISCAGCHGRQEDNTVANPEVLDGGSGYGAGLRQHHFRGGIVVCDNCHMDADPANYMPVGEDVLPTYYATPGTNHPAMPTASCNDDASENFAGTAEGLDNDGDGSYDGGDGDCNATSTPELPALASLSQNVPNPFNPQTSISYRMLAPGWAQIRVFNAQGQLVRNLVRTHHDEVGNYTVRWDGRDSKGRALSSGVYFYNLEALGVSEIRKAVLVR